MLLLWYRKCALLGVNLESSLVWVEWGYKFSTEVLGQPQRSGWLQGDGWDLSHHLPFFPSSCPFYLVSRRSLQPHGLSLSSLQGMGIGALGDPRLPDSQGHPRRQKWPFSLHLIFSLLFSSLKEHTSSSAQGECGFYMPGSGPEAVTHGPTMWVSVLICVAPEKAWHAGELRTIATHSHGDP